MEDPIGERQKKERAGHSVIKYWRVRYEMEDPEPIHVPEPENASAGAAEEEDEATRVAREVYERLQAEAAADDAKLIAEQQAAYAEAAAKEANVSAEEAAWRERTGATGVYGKNAFENDEEAAKVAAILSERSDAFEDMLGSVKEE